MSRFFVLTGAIAGFLGVALGAFGAHGLSGRIAENLVNAFNTGAQYQMYHALALLAVGVLLHQFPERRLLRWSGLFFLMGILLFSGSLYLLAVTELRWFGPVTPLGGLSFMVGWLFLAFSVVRKDKDV